MSERPWPIRLALAGFGVLSLGCGFGDLFGSSEPERVVLTYVGDTAAFLRCERRAFAITVQVAGAPVQNPRLLLSVSDDSIISLTSQADSLVAHNNTGPVTLVARLASSWLTDSLPTLAQPLSVGGGQPCP
jgi:3-deoxy-D-arabino-heptulosonate 7-phosphate (DAHP) synthase class II